MGTNAGLTPADASGETASEWSGADLLFETLRDLFESSTRDAIERTVCKRLADSAQYEFAWIGRPDSENGGIVPRIGAGPDADGETRTVTPTETPRVHGPAERAFRSGEVQRRREVSADAVPDPWCRGVLDAAVRSVAAVPLVHGDAISGVLVAYATRPLAFGPREQAALELLGEAVGFGIRAVENRNLLFADTVVELEFAVTDPGLVYVRVSDRFDCELTVTGHVASASGEWSVYLRVEGASPSALCEAMADDPAVEQARVVVDDTNGGLVEVVTHDSALNEITDYGAMLTSGRAEEGRGRFHIEVPQTADVRQLVEQFRATCPEARLVAQREFDRPVQKAGELRQSIHDQLTDRQQEALSRAYRSGYFEWPRTSTASDVAESMGVAETTFHYHLRNALEKLLAELTDLNRRGWDADAA